MADQDPLKDLTLNGTELSARVSRMITAASLERTMEGPSLLRLSLFDPDYWLTRMSGVIGERGFRTTCEWQGRQFTLRQLDKTEDGFELEFIVTAAAILSRRKPRGPTDFRKTSRARLTRAEAVAAVCGRLGVAFARWEGMHERQPIESFTRKERQVLDDAKASDKAQARTRSRIAKGALNGKGITIKRAAATGQQRRALRDALSVAEVHGMPVKPTLAMLIAGIAEGQFVPDRPNQAGSGAMGPWQIMPKTAAYLGISPTDVQAGAAAFLVGIRVQGRLQSFTGLPGAIQLSKQRPELSAPELANLLEGGGAGPEFYAPWMGEAGKILRAWSPGDDEQSDDITALTGTPDRARRARYEFRVNPGETYFEAIVRWADEVRWRFFILDTPEHPEGMVWFIDDLTLARAAPSAVVAEGDRGVNRILYSRTLRGRIDSMTIHGQAEFWDYKPGQCIIVNGEGAPADGRWLIRSIEHDLLDEAGMVEVTLGQPKAPKPEPKPSILQSSGTDPYDKNENPDSRPAKGGLEVGYPLARRGKDIGGAAAHGARAWGNWQSDNAVDIAVPMGTDVFAVQDGTIVKLGGVWASASANPNGFNITLKSEDNQWFYTHLHERSPKLFVGKQVERGEYFGKSGAANGVEHLHIGCMRGDPENLLGLP